MISTRRMEAVDRNAEAMGVPRRQLMESSGNAIAREVRDMVDPEARVVFVCGRGNNGGDGFVAARFLDDLDVRVQLLGRADGIGTDIAAANWEALAAGEYDREEIRDSTAIELPSCDLVVDAVVGTGVTGALREPAATAARRINDHDAQVLSVDVPSGVDADTGEAEAAAVQPDRVVTFHDRKPGLAEIDAEVTVADIGIPAAAELFVERGDLYDLHRDPESHKGDAGQMLVIGGGPYAGAPALSAMATLRAGADLAFVACPTSVAGTVASFSPNLIAQPLDGDRLEPGHVDRLTARAEDADVVVLGPGLGDAEPTLEAVRTFLGGYEGRCVIDADALGEVPDVETDASLICTPHAGEFAAMGGTRADDWRERMDTVTALADELDVTVLHKGRYDVAGDGDDVRVNRTGNAGMTVGGTGDVLAGVSAAMFANEDRPALDAAAIAAYVTGAAGDRQASDQGYGLVATDLLDAIPAVLWPDGTA